MAEIASYDLSGLRGYSLAVMLALSKRECLENPVLSYLLPLLTEH